jgi:phosphoribosylformylglycinamidine synthase PurS subunit
MVKARVIVTLKPGVLDPQGKAVMNSLLALGYPGVREVRQGKYLELQLDEPGGSEGVRELVEEMCRRLLANPVIEKYSFEILE